MTVPTKFSGMSMVRTSDGLHELVVDALGDDGGARDHELEAFAAHHFDEHGELQLAAAEDLEVVRGAGIFDADARRW